MSDVAFQAPEPAATPASEPSQPEPPQPEPPESAPPESALQESTPPVPRGSAGWRARAAVLVIAPLLGVGAARTIVANLPGVHRSADCAQHGAASAQCSAGVSQNSPRR